MEQMELRALLDKVAAGDVDISSAMQQLQNLSGTDSIYAAPDLRRPVRQGASEVICGAGKNAVQIAGIAETLLSVGQRSVLITRLDPEKATEVRASVPLIYSEMGRIGVAGVMPEADGRGPVLVAIGDANDMPVAEEAAFTAEAMGNDVIRLYDVGVTSLHRLLSHSEELRKARVIIAIAGMDGALASVIGGLVSCPVIAVPTSAGHGASFGGVSALLSMLNSCAPGVSVVNIDNGFGAGFLASRINHMEP